MRGRRTRFLRLDLVHTTVRPVRDERPALDRFLYNDRVGEALSYQRDVNFSNFLEALEVGRALVKNKINLL